VVRDLLEREGFAADRVLLVVNGDGGLADPGLERRVQVLRLPENAGPAGGFSTGLREAHRRFGTGWYYLSEDDVGLYGLPSPRVAGLLEAAGRVGTGGRAVGAIVAYGRDLDHRTGLTSPHRPRAGAGLEPVDVAAWGATLVSREVLDAGIWPDPAWFFGYEDFDFFLRVATNGFAVLLDVASARAMAASARPDHGAAAGGGGVEPWRAYYQARNFLELSRRHGSPRWSIVHVAKTLRRAQLAGTWAGRRATARGLLDGFRRVLGPRPGFPPDR